MRRLSIAAVLLLAAPLAGAQVFKWTDAKGTVHYAQTPPPAGTRYSRVTVTGSVEPIAPPPSDASPAEPTSADDAASGDRPMADTPANRVKLCRSLQGNLATLKGSGPVVMEVDGRQQVMDAAQRKQQLAATKAQYRQYCSG